MRHYTRANMLRRVGYMLDLNLILDEIEEIEVSRVRDEVRSLKSEIEHTKDVRYDGINRTVLFISIDKVPVELIERAYQKNIKDIL